jgi:glycosyltransferase involved in cell wall biosynthesis
LKGNKILVLTYWPFNSGLFGSYVLPYLDLMRKQLPAGANIFVFTLTPPLAGYELKFKEVQKELSVKGITLIDYRYDTFGVRMFFRFIYITLGLLRLIYSKKIDTIHAWCTPAGGLGYILSVLTGKKLVLDSFEPHAEAMAEGGNWSKKGFRYKVLFTLERLQLKRASEVICAAPGMPEYSQQVYGILKNRYFIKPACVDLQLFNLLVGIKPISELKNNVCVYAGKFGGLYLESEVFDFFKIAYDYWNYDFSVLLLTSHSDKEIKEYCRAAELPPEVIHKKLVDHKDVPFYMEQGHFGICPNIPVPSKKYGSPVKNGEYWAMGLPVVITKDISEDSDIISRHNAGYVLQSLDEQEYHRAVQKIDALIREPGHRERIRQLAVQYRNYSIAEGVYREIYG